MKQPFRHSWNYYNPVKVLAGEGIFDNIPEIVPGGKILLVTSPFSVKRGLAEQGVKSLKPLNTVIYDSVTPNPELCDLEKAGLELCGHGFASIIALGGGSVIDTAKAFAVMLSNPGASLSAVLKEKIRTDHGRRIFLLAIPTTSGTGSEITPFATVWDSEAKKKLSLSGERVYPDIALLDPLLTLSVPGDITLNTGLDAISHALESLWNINRSPLSQGTALYSLELSLKALPKALAEPGNIESRAEMQWASNLAGFCISQTRTALAHAISYPLTVRFGVPHGLAAGFCLRELIKDFIKRGPGLLYGCNTLERVSAMLKEFRLSEKLLAYCSASQVLSLVGEMFDPARAGNYILKADSKFVEAIISESMD